MPKELAQVDRLFDIVVAFVLTHSIQIIVAIVLLLVGVKLSAIAANLLQSLLLRQKVDVTLARFLSNVARIVLLAVLLVIVAGQSGINVTPLVATLGAATLGITVALQGVLSNYAAGVTIILTRPFRIGDTIGVRAVTGLVEDITLAATVLRGDNGERITVPNRQILGEILVNSAAFRIVDVKIAVPQRAAAENALSSLRAALEANARVEGAPEPQVGVHEFTDTGVVLGVRYWAPTADYYRTRYAVNAALGRALLDSGIDAAPAA